MLHSPAVKQLIASGAEMAKVRDQALKEGMKPLRVSGAMKIGAGLTTVDEVLKVSPPARDAGS